MNDLASRGATSRRRGLTAERDLARWLRANGWPHAERSVVTGYRTGDRERRDGGDITGTPGIVWSQKDSAVERIAQWWTELEAMDGGRSVRLLVVKRRGHANPGLWWCWLTLAQIVDLLPTKDQLSQLVPVHGLTRTQLNVVAPLLHLAGYGEPGVAACHPDASGRSADGRS